MSDWILTSCQPHRITSGQHGRGRDWVMTVSVKIENLTCLWMRESVAVATTVTYPEMYDMSGLACSNSVLLYVHRDHSYRDCYSIRDGGAQDALSTFTQFLSAGTRVNYRQLSTVTVWFVSHQNPGELSSLLPDPPFSKCLCGCVLFVFCCRVCRLSCRFL